MALWPASAIVGVFEWVLLKIYFANYPTSPAISPLPPLPWAFLTFVSNSLTSLASQ